MRDANKDKCGVLAGMVGVAEGGEKGSELANGTSGCFGGRSCNRRTGCARLAGPACKRNNDRVIIAFRVHSRPAKKARQSELQ